MADIVSRKVRSRMMSSIRSRDTKPELQVRRHLHRLGYRYRLSPKHLPGKPDLVFPKHGAVIFVHGCFWHGHAGCRYAKMPSTRAAFWKAKLEGNRERDEMCVRQLRREGWRVAVIWECALKEGPGQALQRTVDFVSGAQERAEISA